MSHVYFPKTDQILATESKLLKIYVCNLNTLTDFDTNNQIFIFVL